MLEYKRPTNEVICYYCKSKFYKEQREITRSNKRNANHFCSKSCSSKNMMNEKYKGTNKFRSFISTTKARAKQKNLEFDLDVDFLENLYKNQKGKCAITKVLMQLDNVGRGSKNIMQASLDRVDNSKGYIKGNVQFTLLGINYMRNTFDLEDVKALLSHLHM